MSGTTNLDYDKVKGNINRISQALADSDMGEVSTHLLVLQQQLQGAPHLVDMLHPEDIGVLVTAERRRMTEDILAQSMPKKRVSRKKPQTVLNLANLDLDLGDF